MCVLGLKIKTQHYNYLKCKHISVTNDVHNCSQKNVEWNCQDKHQKIYPNMKVTLAVTCPFKRI